MIKTDPASKYIVSSMLLKAGILTEAQLVRFLGKVLETRIPNRVNCGSSAHSSPFSLLSSMFFGKVEDAIGYANRSGGKSFLAGLLTFLRGIGHASSTRLLGGSVDQSDKSYQAFADCWTVSELGEKYLDGDVQQKKTNLKNRARVEILTASQKSVRGPHQPNLILDEVEEMERDIFTAALSQPQSKDGVKASTLILSTRHRADGIMSELLENHQKMRLKLFAWCIWEVLASCKDYQCSTCPVAALCPGKQMKNADGYYEIGDFEKKLYQLDEETLETEWLCLKPSRKHLVYSKFDENVHIIDCDFNPSLPLALSNDFGGIDPNVVLVWQKRPQGDVIVDEFYQENTSTQEAIQLCRGRLWWPYSRGKDAYCDPSDQNSIRQWRAAGIDAHGQRSTIDDISLVRTKIQPMRGKPTLFVNRKCKRTIWEFNHYRCDANGHPIKKNDHTMDGIRYYVRGTKDPSSSKPHIILGMYRSLLGRPLENWPFWKGDE